VTDADAAAVLEAASVKTTDIVCAPAALYVVLKLVPAPVEGVPPVAVQAKV